MNTLETLLDDTGRVDDLEPAGLARGRVVVHRAATAVTPAVPPHLARRRRRLTLAGAAVAVAAAVVTVPVVSFGGGGTSANADAAGLLRRAGAAAGDQPGGWPDAAYWHSASSYVREGRTFRREIWVAHRGGPTVLRDTGLPDPDGRVNGDVVIPGGGVFSAGGTSLTWDQLYALPTDPGRLRAELASDLHGAGPDPTTELFVAVGDLLRESPASPALREALYDVAAGIPGVRVTGKVTDAAGRSGTGVTYGHETYVIDPATGRLLADVEPGWRATYLDQGPSDTAPALPAK